MRLGYLVPEFPSQTHAFFWREIVALREQGHDVTIFSTRRPSEDPSRHAFTRQATSETVYLWPPRIRDVARTFGRLGPRRALAVIRYLRSCTTTDATDGIRMLALSVGAAGLAARAQQLQLDHLHVHSCADAAHLGAIAARMGGPSYSLTLHGDLPVYGRDHRIKMAGALFVAAVTRPLQQQVTTQVGIPIAKAPVVMMGVDTDRFLPHPIEEPQPVADRALELLTVARLNPTKGHEIALKAIRDVIDQGIRINYRIAGAGRERESIEAEIDSLGLEGSVEMLGNVSEDEVLSLLRTAQVFVLPSFGLGEAAPVSIMEAMACGVPVVSSSIGGTPDMIDDGVDGFLVPQRDVQALARSLFLLGRDPGLRAQLGLRAREKAQLSFDFRRNARLLSDHMS